MNMKNTFAFFLAFVFSVQFIVAGLAQREQVDGHIGLTPTPTATFTGTPCPTLTPEPLWVEPVTSPTDALTQTIEVMIGNGEVVTVTAQSGEFTETGMFGISNLAEVEIDLLPNTTHDLTVQGKVRVIEQGDCTFGGYVLSTTVDRFGQPLTIVQQATTATPTPTLSPTPTPTGQIGPLNVSGVVYAETDMPGNELQDALVSCSIFSSSICTPEKMTTDSDGVFAFNLGFVHETTPIQIIAQKTGYISDTFGFIGLQCIGGCPEVTLILEAVEMSDTPTPTNTPTDTPTPSPTLTPTLTGTPCPIGTPVPLWVEPITSPTELLTQTIEVRIGSGEAVTVTAESGIFALTGAFDVDNNPALVEIDLLPNTTHNLTVEGKVAASQVGDCIYESYIRSTTLDRFGDPLVIVQQSKNTTPTPTSTPTISPTVLDWKLYLPMIVR